MKRNSSNRIIVFALLHLVVFNFSNCKRQQEKIKPVLGSVSESVYASGTIKSKDQYEAFAQANGIIENIFVKEGDTVKKGQALLFIANDIQRLAKENAELAAKFSDLSVNQSKLTEAKAIVELAKAKLLNDSILYLRQSALWAQDIGTKTDLEQRELAFINAKTAYQSSITKRDDLKRQLEFNSSQAKNNLQISGTTESDFTLRSELDGIVYSLNKVKGEMVTVQMPLAVIGDAKIFVLEMQVDENDIVKIKKDLPILVALDSYQGSVFSARVTRIFPLMNERNKTFLVEAEFTKAPPIVYPNTTFEANIVLSRKENVLLIPRNILLNDSIVTKANGEKVLVKTGLKDYQFIEIISGISKNDELVKPD